METTATVAPYPNTCDVGHDLPWAVAGSFLDALTRRDFGALEACLDPDVRFRALVPRGPFEVVGAVATVDRFRQWFGNSTVFEVLDAAIGQIGGRFYLRWQLRSCPPSTPGTAAVVEQHVFLTANGSIRTLDLLCSGFQPAPAPTPTP